MGATIQKFLQNVFQFSQVFEDRFAAYEGVVGGPASRCLFPNQDKTESKAEDVSAYKEVVQVIQTWQADNKDYIDRTLDSFLPESAARKVTVRLRSLPSPHLSYFPLFSSPNKF